MLKISKAAKNAFLANEGVICYNVKTKKAIVLTKSLMEASFGAKIGIAELKFGYPNGHIMTKDEWKNLITNDNVRSYCSRRNVRLLFSICFLTIEKMGQ